ncbi:hypothetical protein ACT6QH_03245 [Xanthobacter sp. TB0139]|uniref:hypothetical protein n=1 Tax=Xanthobacter sp. TB0139 TaxID=3459178 RepID=UPI0040395699
MIPDLSPFLHLRRFVTIAHHVPGRIRMKLDMKALAHLPKVDPSPFVDLIARVQGVQSTRVNKAALSVVVEYDPKKIAFPIWEKLLKADAAEVTQILQQHTA